MNSFQTIARPFERFAESIPWFYPIMIGLLVLLVVFLLIAIKVRRRNTPVRVFNNTSGHVMVSRQALHELVRTATMEVGVAGKPKCRFYNHHGRLSLDIHVRLEHKQRAIDVCSAIQNHLSRALRDSLGVDRLGAINVTIDGYKGKGQPRTTSSPLDRKKASGPVPVYGRDEEEQANAKTDKQTKTEPVNQASAAAAADTSPASPIKDPEEKTDEHKGKSPGGIFGRREADPASDEDKKDDEKDPWKKSTREGQAGK